MKDPWVVRWTTSPPPAAAVYCIGHAGAGAAPFGHWQEDFLPDVELAAIRLPGRESRIREEPSTDLRELVAALATAIEDDRPFALFGTCVGALLAFEVARELRARGAPTPCRLLVAAQAPPEVWARAVRAAPSAPDLWERVRRLGGTDPTVLDHPELMELLAPALRADFALSDGYEYLPGPPLDCPITVFRGRDDPHLDRAVAEGWAGETAAEVEVVDVESAHVFGAEAWGWLGGALAATLRSDLLAVSR